MAESDNNELNFESIYDDTNYFINAIVSDYGFYGDFINAVRGGGSRLEVKRKHLKKTVDSSWVTAIEECLTALDIVIRTPSKEIVEREEVLPIELSHNISSRSLQHLAQHTDYINRIEGDSVIPSKILNVFHDESLMTYENRFINTLVHRLYVFVNKRYVQLKTDGFNAQNIMMDFQSDFSVGRTKGKISLNMEVSDDNAKLDSDGGGSWFERVERINSIITQYMESEFIKSLGQNFVRPPIMHTNAITKNRELRQCLILWEFIESYDKVGYTIAVNESAEKPDDEYIDSLYSMLALEYLMFKYNLEYDFKNSMKTFAKQDSVRPIEPKFVTRFREIDAKDYDMYDSVYRKVISVSYLPTKRKLSRDEIKIRDAVDDALAADKQIELRSRVPKRRGRRVSPANAQNK